MFVFSCLRGAGEDAVCALLAPRGTPIPSTAQPLPEMGLCQARHPLASDETSFVLLSPNRPLSHCQRPPGLQQGQDKVRILTSGGPAKLVGDDPGVALLSLFLPPLCTCPPAALQSPPWLHPVLASQAKNTPLPCRLHLLVDPRPWLALTSQGHGHPSLTSFPTLSFLLPGVMGDKE